MKIHTFIFTTIVLIGLLIPSLQSVSFKADNSINDSYYLENTFVCRITPPLESTDIPNDMEIIGGKPGEYHDILAPMNIINNIAEKGYNIQMLDEDIATLSSSYASEYHSLQEMEEYLFTIADNFSDITQLTSIGKSYEDRDIWCLEITDNPGNDEGEPGVLYMGLHHAREWPTLEICLYLIDLLTEGYRSDSHIASLINERRIWIIPCVNPDGYYFCHDLGNDWRKNRHYLEDISVYGIDLNRNYGGSTNGNPLGMWGSAGMSHLPNNEVYCGSYPFSELETNAIKQFFLSHDICTSISWHTYSELVLWPWGFSEDYQTPDDEYLSHVGSEIASRIKKQTGSGSYVPTQSAGLYPTTGDTTDWMYGYSHYVLGKPHFPFTIEACASFHPSANVLPQICAENTDGALYLLEEAASIQSLQPRVTPPIITNISNDGKGLITVFWDENNPLALTEKFELKEYRTVAIQADNADDPSKFWDMDGFIKTSADSYSSEHSYWPYPGNNGVSIMITKNPVPIKKGMVLSFYCTYDIEKDYDKAFVEISTDGRNFEVLDSFTGHESSWVKKEYSLSSYIDTSIFIRFRYYTNPSGLGEGFFVDDIYPVASYESCTSIDDNIRDTTYTTNNPTSDESFYQVRGYNEKFGWGDWSMLASANYTYYYGFPPQTPSIQGPIEAKIGQPITYQILSFDKDSDDVYYYIDWGDETRSDWIGPYPSNESIDVNHTWQTTGSYTINVQVKDDSGLLSDKGTLDVSLSKYKNIFSQWFHLLDHLKYLFQLLFSN